MPCIMMGSKLSCCFNSTKQGNVCSVLSKVIRTLYEFSGYCSTAGKKYTAVNANLPTHVIHCPSNKLNKNIGRTSVTMTQAKWGIFLSQVYYGPPFIKSPSRCPFSDIVHQFIDEDVWNLNISHLFKWSPMFFF